MIEAELVILALIYAGAGVAFVRAVILRREAVAAWRQAAGGTFDKRQHKFITDLDLDRARLPPLAARKLIESRRVLVAGSAALMIALLLNFLVLRPR
ncbi:MAG: hypothetical protein JNJ73_12010 [Hyphomonadaceae bacterium]|nr:hypothetical protein [Hyphomonadaceae bacterium]